MARLTLSHKRICVTMMICKNYLDTTLGDLEWLTSCIAFLLRVQSPLSPRPSSTNLWPIASAVQR